MSEFAVDPNKLEWLAAQPGNQRVGGDGLSYQERADGAVRAQRIIDAWATTEREKGFLEALSAGHEIAEARRLSGIKRSQADDLLRRMRGDRARSHKQL